MKWTRFRIQTTTEAEDVLISNLYDLGFEGAQIEDKIPLSPLEKEQMFVDILPETAADDGVAFVSFFVETDEKGLLLPDRDVFEGEKNFGEKRKEKGGGGKDRGEAQIPARKKKTPNRV